MNISRALKEKNKKLGKINTLWSRVIRYNSILEENEREFNVREIYEQIKVETNEYIILKTKIHEACMPVRDKIFRISELKSFVGRLKSVESKNGYYSDRYSDRGMRYKAEFGKTEIDSLIEGVELEIEKIQEELDYFNHTTHLK